MKNSVSRLDFSKFNENSIGYILRPGQFYWRQSITMLLLVVTVLFTNSTVNAQGSLRGIVPVLEPKSGSAVDGDAFAHTPAGYENVGDLFDSEHPGIDGHGVINPYFILKNLFFYRTGIKKI
jgi:hypothetical protein